MRKKNIIVSIIAIILTIGIISGILFLISKIRVEELLINEELEREVGEILPQVKDYFIDVQDVDGELEYLKGKEKIDLKSLTKAETYDVKIKINGKEYFSKLKVIDNYPPDLTLKELEIMEREDYNLESFVTSCKDNSNAECLLKFQNEDMSSLKEPGAHSIIIIASDQSGNETTKETKLTIKEVSNSSGNKTPSTTNEPIKEVQKEIEQEIPPTISYNQEIVGKEPEEEQIEITDQEQNDTEKLLAEILIMQLENQVNMELDEDLIELSFIKAYLLKQNYNVQNWNSLLTQAGINTSNLKEINFTASSFEEANQKLNEYTSTLLNPKYNYIGAGVMGSNWVIFLNK